MLVVFLRDSHPRRSISASTMWKNVKNNCLTSSCPRLCNLPEKLRRPNGAASWLPYKGAVRRVLDNSPRLRNARSGVSRQLLTAETALAPMSVHAGSVADTVALGHVLVGVLPFSLSQHSTATPHSLTYLQRDGQRER